MKSMVVAVAIVLLATSTAFGGWVYTSPAVPTAVVHSYWPVGPVYAYPRPMVVARPVLVPPPVVYPPAVVAPRAVWASPWVTVRPKVYVRGQPVRNVIRAALP